MTQPQTQTHRPRRSVRALAAAAATAAMTAGGLVLASVPAQAAGNGCPPPSATPPTLNTWYDAHGKYQGTRQVSREQYRAIQATVVYETFGPDYRQVETWDLRIVGDPMRLECERQEENPDPKPSEPIKIGGGGGGGAASSGGYYMPGGNYTIWVNPPTPRVTVGPAESIQAH